MIGMQERYSWRIWTTWETDRWGHVSHSGHRGRVVSGRGRPSCLASIGYDSWGEDTQLTKGAGGEHVDEPSLYQYNMHIMYLAPTHASTFYNYTKRVESDGRITSGG